MFRTSSARSRRLTVARLLVPLALAALLPGGVAWGGPFTVEVATEYYPPDNTTGFLVLDVRLHSNVDGQNWYMNDLEIIHPHNEQGEWLYFKIDQYLGWNDLAYSTGGTSIRPGAYWIWPDGPTGRFTGGEVVVTAVRYAAGMDLYGEVIETLTERVGFGYVVAGPASVPEPSAAIPAGIAALGGGAFAAARRRRRAG
jgi:hypothetical protein